MGSLIGVTFQLCKKPLSTLSKSAGLETFQTVYWLHFTYDSRTAFLLFSVLRSGVFSPHAQWESLYRMERPLKTKEEMNKTAEERSGAVDHAMRLLTSQWFSHPHAFHSNRSLYTFEDDMLLKWNAVEQPQLTDPAHLLVLGSLLDKVVRPLHTE